jgi:hypothetical protein
MDSSVSDHEYRHRYNVGEFAASLLQSLAQAGEERAYLPIEIAGKRTVWLAGRTSPPTDASGKSPA